MALTTALERKDYGEVCRAMDLVRAQGLQRASVAVKAREFIASAQRLIFSIEHVQLAVSSAKKHGGLTQALHDQLVNVALAADTLVGVPGLEAVRSEIRAYEAEAALLEALKSAVAIGAFVLDSKVKCGDYSNYPRTWDGSWIDAEAQLESLRKHEVVSKEGRWLEYFSSRIIALRKLMVPMLAEESKSAEACDAVLAYLAAGSSDEFYSQLAANAEWQCCHREANYQKQVLSVLSKIRSISGAAGSVELSSTADELSSAVKRAEELNMSSLDEVSVAKGFHGQILSLVGSSSRREKNSFFALSVQDAKNL